MSRPRILHLIARMNMGGTATYIANLMEGMKEGPYANLLAIGNVPRGEIEDPVVDSLDIRRILQLSREISLSDAHARRSFRELVREFKPDLIHSHTFKAGVISRSIPFEGPRVHSFHGHHLYDPEFGSAKIKVLNLIEKALVKRTDRFISIGGRVRDELIEAGIGTKEMYRAIAPGIKPLKLADRNEVISKFGLNADRPIVMWLGRFTEVKRPDRVAQLARALPEFQFVMAGGGELEASIKVEQIPNLHCLGWQEKASMWAIADISLCTSDSEGMPLSLIEAQMSGVPVVSTDVGSVSEIVEDGVTGILVPRSGDGMSAAIREVVERISVDNTMSLKSKERAERLYSVKKMVEAHESLYAELLG